MSLAQPMTAVLVTFKPSNHGESPNMVESVKKKSQ